MNRRPPNIALRSINCRTGFDRTIDGRLSPFIRLAIGSLASVEQPAAPAHQDASRGRQASAHYSLGFAAHYRMGDASASTTCFTSSRTASFVRSLGISAMIWRLTSGCSVARSSAGVRGGATMTSAVAFPLRMISSAARATRFVNRYSSSSCQFVGSTAPSDRRRSPLRSVPHDH
jgi:hypothetical protein